MAKAAEHVSCVRCNLPKQFIGTRSFHEGKRWGILGDLGELFVEKATFDVYACPRCGSVELFVDGLGEHLRSTTSNPGSMNP